MNKLPGGIAATRFSGWGVFAAFISLLVWTEILRLPFWKNVSSDEMLFTIMGREWLHGGLPYVTSFDVKPPGLFALFAIAQAFGGNTFLSIKLMETIAVALTALGLFLIGRRYFSLKVAICTAVLYPFCSLFLSGTEVPTELLQAPFETFAVFLMLAPAEQRSLRAIALAGFLLGAAMMIRQSAIFEAFVIGLILICEAKHARILHAGIYAAGILVFPVVFAGYFAAEGHFKVFWTASVLLAAARTRGDNISFIAGLIRFLPMMRPLLALFVMSLLVWTEREFIKATKYLRPTLIIVAWLLGCVLAVIATRSMYNHYFLALVPAMLLLSAILMFHAGQKLLGWAGSATPVIFLAAVVAPLLIYDAADLSQPSSDIAAERAVADQLRAAGLQSSDRLLVLDRGLFIYIASGATPSGRYIFPQHLLCNFPGVGADPLADVLKTKPQYIVLTARSRIMPCERPDRLAQLDHVIGTEYADIGHVNGHGESFNLYKLQ